MAFSSCPKCGNTFFEVDIKEPSGSNFKLLFVQCSSCGSVVGTMDYYNIGAKINDVISKLDDLTTKVNWLQSNQAIINDNVLDIQRKIK